MARRGRITPLAVARASVADGWRPRFEKEIAAVLSAFWADAARSLSAAGTLPDSGAWARRLTEAKRPLLRAMAADGWRLGAAELGGKSAIMRALGKATATEIDEADAELYELAAGRRLSARVDKWLERTSKIETATTRGRIEDLYRLAVAERKTPAQVAADLLDARIAENHVRASLLARTNTIWAYNSGAEASYDDAGIERKEWLTGHDELTCDWCGPMDGTPANVGGPFLREGQVLDAGGRELLIPWDISFPPLHPNCRCAIVPVV